MKHLIKIEKKFHLPFLLTLVSIHSFLVGVGLILFPGELMEFIGFQLVHEKFFQAQAGIFHIILSIGYILPVINYNNFKDLVIFSIIVKIIAALFLFIYFLFFDSIVCVLLSGLGDCTMAVLLFYVYHNRQKRDKK
ncbi:MAG: hypothetical protein ABFR31_06960 [Thermodesulfobacteriota bacterium]